MHPTALRLQELLRVEVAVLNVPLNHLVVVDGLLQGFQSLHRRYLYLRAMGFSLCFVVAIGMDGDHSIQGESDCGLR